jgi:hypothetical protein
MANQMIALQARNPQLPDPARATTQMANMMNMASQQRAAQLQGERIRQDMEYARAGETRAAETHTSAQKKADLEYVGLATKQFSEDVAKLKDGDLAGAEAVRANIVNLIPSWNSYIRPASEWTSEYRTQLMSKASEIVAQTNPPAQSRVEYTAEGAEDEQGNPIPKGTAVQVTTGLRPSVKVIRNAPAAAAPQTPTTPQPSAMGREPSAASDAAMTFGPDATRPLNAYQQEDLRNLEGELGMQDTPASFTRGGMGGAGAAQMTPDVMSRIVDSAFETGVMAQVDFDQLLASQPPQNKQALMDTFQRANIRLQADAPSLADSGMGQQQQMAANPVQRPDAGFADMRGPTPPSQTAGLGGDMPMMRNTQAQYTPLQVRDPRVPVAPASSVVPLGRLGAEKTTEAQAAADVNLRMAPAIAEATKKAERAVELKSTATKAKYATEGIINEVVDRINTIDQLLRNPNRFSIVGAIEGNLPRLLQTGARADAQAAFDKIKNTATLTSLIDMRKSTETGASPVGANPTDKDAKIVEQAASKLIQTGEPATFDAELIDMRRKLYRTFQSAQREYDGVYGEVLKANPNLRLAVPKVSDRYISSKDLPKQKTPVKTPTSRLSAETRAKYGL